jgi:hypothetical protein
MRRRYLKGRVASVCEWGRAVPPPEVHVIANIAVPWNYLNWWINGSLLTYFNMEEGGLAVREQVTLQDSLHLNDPDYYAYAMPRTEVRRCD